MQIKDIATMVVESVHPTDSASSVALKMKLFDIGFVPVVEAGKPIGVITDRDIALRVTAEGKDPNLVYAREIMSPHVHSVHEDADAGEAAWVMSNAGVRRILVVNQRGVGVGVVSLDDLAVFTDGNQTTGRVLNHLAKSRREGLSARRV